MDRRRVAENEGNTALPDGEVDLKRMLLTLDDCYFEDDEDADRDVPATLPLKYDVCPVCAGKGTYVNPSIDEHGITAEERDRDWSPEDWEGYMGGAYDVTCACCQGLRVVLVPALLENSPEERWYEAWLEDEAEDRRVREWEVRHGY